MITNSRLADNLLVFFPLWFPIFYVFLILNLPAFTSSLFIISLFLFAETHFGSTWLFFIDRGNWPWIVRNGYKLIFLPVYICFIILFIWKYNPSLVLLLHYVASGYHVTRQSLGITNMVGAKNSLNRLLIYIFSFASLFVGLTHPGFIQLKLPTLTINLLLFLILCIYVFLITKDATNEAFKSRYLISGFSVFTGVSIFMPLLFIENRASALTIGVGMHWIQYLTLMWTIKFRKINLNTSNINLLEKFRKSAFSIILLLVYAALMTSLTLIGSPESKTFGYSYNYLYLIPILFHLYHFYVDGFIWRFSDLDIRRSVFKYLTKSK